MECGLSSRASTQTRHKPSNGSPPIVSAESTTRPGSLTHSKEARETAEAARDLEARLRRQETAAYQAAELERDQQIRLRREETAARRAAEARITELERQLGAQ